MTTPSTLCPGSGQECQGEAGANTKNPALVCGEQPCLPGRFLLPLHSPLNPVPPQTPALLLPRSHALVPTP